MITQRSDYKFVTGDIDDVVIDGNIMPLRVGPQQKLLRGVDPCFLLEAVCERNQALRRYSASSPVAADYIEPGGTRDMTKRVDATQMQFVKNGNANFYGIRQMYDASTYKWIKTGEDIPGGVHEHDDESHIWDDCENSLYSFADMTSPDVASGDQVLAAPVLARFADLRPLRRFVQFGDTVQFRYNGSSVNARAAWNDGTTQYYADSGTVTVASKSWCTASSKHWLTGEIQWNDQQGHASIQYFRVMTETTNLDPQALCTSIASSLGLSGYLYEIQIRSAWSQWQLTDHTNY